MKDMPNGMKIPLDDHKQFPMNEEVTFRMDEAYGW